MILGLLPGAGAGIRTLQRSGQHERLVHDYFRAYIAAFDHVHYFSYLDEALPDYTDDPQLLAGVTMWPRRVRMPYRLYAGVLPLIYGRQLAQCDALRVFQTTGALPAIVARVVYGIPYVTTYGYSYAEFAQVEGRHLKALWLKWVERTALRWAAAVIVTTQELANLVSGRIGTQRVYLIPNGVDTSLFAPGHKLPDDYPPTIGFVGRLERQKNLDLLIDAAASMDIGVRLLLIGEGKLRSELEQQAARLGVEASFTGTLPHKQLPDYLRRCSVFVLPSLIEGHPKALIEAMACELPCIVSDCMGNRAVISDGYNGLLFPRGDGAALRAQLERVFRDPALARRLGQEARKTAVERFDLTRVLAREVALLKEVASRYPHRKGS